MSDQRGLLSILQVSDSSFPSGAFAFSNGLEGLLRDNIVTGPDGVENILSNHVVPRWMTFDRVFLSAAHAAGNEVQELVRLDADCDVRNTTPALRDASLSIGRSLLTTHARMGTRDAETLRMQLRRGAFHAHAPIVQGAMGAAMGLDCDAITASALYGQIASFASAAVRMGRLGALEAQKMLVRILAEAANALDEPCPDIPTGFAPLLDISVSRRPAGHARLFTN